MENTQQQKTAYYLIIVTLNRKYFIKEGFYEIKKNKKFK